MDDVQTLRFTVLLVFVDHNRENIQSFLLTFGISFGETAKIKWNVYRRPDFAI